MSTTCTGLRIELDHPATPRAVALLRDQGLLRSRSAIAAIEAAQRDGLSFAIIAGCLTRADAAAKGSAGFDLETALAGLDGHDAWQTTWFCFGSRDAAAALDARLAAVAAVAGTA